MNSYQKAAIGNCLPQLVEALEPRPLVVYLLTRNVISFSERDRIESQVTDAYKNVEIFEILRHKTSAWPELIAFLNDHQQRSLAARLQSYAGGVPGDIEVEQRQSTDSDESTESPTTPTIHSPFLSPTLPPKPKRSYLERFSYRLAAHYQGRYANMPTMGESPKHVKDVWVPMQIDGKLEDHLHADKVDHIELLRRLNLTAGFNVALIKGDPGMGKTTLAKKIAYDWATNYGSSKEQQFSLVLAVPLRSAGKANRFDQLAIDYFMSIGEGQLVVGLDKPKLVKGINKLKSRLLVILDGLDEYESYAESPFKSLFAAPFQHPFANCIAMPPILTFKLIVTSRPYACERVNMEFFPLRFVILPLDTAHLGEFVTHYCTPKGAAKVSDYHKDNSNLVIQVPLILTFVCFLADSDETIPSNLTVLYDSFIQQMIRRAILLKKLEEKLVLEEWKKSNVVRSTGELAYLGIAEGSDSDRFVFSKKSLEKCRVTNDSFKGGLLLHKFDFSKELLMSEFPHRSIQEFFAALHCYELILSGHKEVMGVVVKLITTEDSQFGRFFMRICSDGWEFHQMANCLGSTLNRSKLCLDEADATINRLSASLIDCSIEESRIIDRIILDSFKDNENMTANSSYQSSSLLPLEQTNQCRMSIYDQPAEMVPSNNDETNSADPDTNVPWLCGCRRLGILHNWHLLRQTRISLNGVRVEGYVFRNPTQSIVENCPLLESIYIGKPIDISYLKNLPNLKRLRIDFNRHQQLFNADCVGLADSFRRPFGQLRKLKVVGVQNLTDFFLTQVANSCPLLEVFHLELGDHQGNYSRSITDLGLDQIVDKCRNLTDFYLAGFPLVTGRSFIGAKVKLPRLKYPVFQRCPNAHSAPLRDDFSENQFAMALRRAYRRFD